MNWLLFIYYEKYTLKEYGIGTFYNKYYHSYDQSIMIKKIAKNYFLTLLYEKSPLTQAFINIIYNQR